MHESFELSFSFDLSKQKTKYAHVLNDNMLKQRS